MKRIAFATCSSKPELQPGDALAASQLREMEVIAAPWDDPSVDWAGFDAIVIRSTWNYYLRYQAFQAWLDRLEATGVPVWNPIGRMRWNTHKTYLRELEREGIPIIPTEWIDPDSPVSAHVARSAWEELIVKPAVSADSFETHRFRREQLAEHEIRLETLQRHGQLLMLQPFLPEIEREGEWSLIYFGKSFSHAVLKRAKAGDFRVQEAHGGTIQALSPPKAALELAERILSRVEQDLLYARVDLIPVSGKFLLGELEITEPSLYLEHSPGAPERFARAIAKSVG